MNILLSLWNREENEIIIIGLLFNVTITILNADCSEDFIFNRINFSEYSKCTEREERNSMSYEEKKLYDLENENSLKRRQIEAEQEKKQLEQEQKQLEEEAKEAEKKEAEKDTAWGKIKSFF